MAHILAAAMPPARTPWGHSLVNATPVILGLDTLAQISTNAPFPGVATLTLSAQTQLDRLPALAVSGILATEPLAEVYSYFDQSLSFLVSNILPPPTHT